MKSTGQFFPGRFSALAAAWRQRMRDALSVTIEVPGFERPIRFRCRSPIEEMRAHSLYVKEAGTIRWIREFVRPGDSFVDVGANVGVYSLLAALAVGPTGRVAAFEPHAANVLTLLENVRINDLAGTIDVFSLALSDKPGIFPFRYGSLEPGSSMSQLEKAGEFHDSVIELKPAESLDRLVASGAVRSPTHVKIDVDGNEPDVLGGMTDLLASNSLISLQVEINVGCGRQVEEFLAAFGFVKHERHDTFHGNLALANGTPPDDVAHNMIFVRN